MAKFKVRPGNELNHSWEDADGERHHKIFTGGEEVEHLSLQQADALRGLLIPVDDEAKAMLAEIPRGEVKGRAHERVGALKQQIDLLEEALEKARAALAEAEGEVKKEMELRAARARKPSEVAKATP